MIWITTGTIVASVTYAHPFGHLSSVQFIRDTMCRARLAVLPELTVAKTILTALPLPSPSFLVNDILFLEAFCYSTFSHDDTFHI